MKKQTFDQQQSKKTLLIALLGSAILSVLLFVQVAPAISMGIWQTVPFLFWLLAKTSAIGYLFNVAIIASIIGIIFMLMKVNRPFQIALLGVAATVMLTRFVAVDVSTVISSLLTGILIFYIAVITSRKISNPKLLWSVVALVVGCCVYLIPKLYQVLI